MNRFAPVAVAAVCLLLAFGLSGDLGATQRWSSDPRLAAFLSCETVVNGYSVRLPAGYEEAPLPASIKSSSLRQRVHLYVADHPDGSVSSIVICVHTPSAVRTSLDTVDGVLKAIEAYNETHCSNLVESAPESGKIGDFDAKRSYFAGRLSGGGQLVHGVIYVARDGPACIGFIGQGTECSYEQRTAIFEASVLTLRRSTPSE